MRGVFDDLRGRRFGRWTVLELAETPQYTSSTGKFYLCRCDCGEEHVISGASLKSGNSRRCGCLRNDICRERIARMTAARKAAASGE